MSQEATEEGRVRVVGTAHVSQESIYEVEEAIETERPDVVAVELDEGRYRQLNGGEPDDIEPSDLLSGNTVFQFIAYWMLSYVQARLGEKFDVTPGADMLAAVETAEDLGIDVALVDRDINETMRRFWTQMGVVEKFRMIGGLAFGVGDNQGVGLAAGAIVGILLGPLVAIFGGSVGIGLPILTRIAGGAILAVAVAAGVWFASGSMAAAEDRLLAALGLGIAVGGIGGVALGLTAPVTDLLGTFVVRVVGSMTLGVGVGLLVGGVLGQFASSFGFGEVEDVEELDMSEMTDTDVVSAMMEEFRQFSPGGAAALIDERDAFIAHKLVALRQNGANVVAVVGAGHRAGIERYLEHPEELPPMESLTGTQGGRIPWAKVVGTGISVVVVGFFVLLALSSAGDDTLLRLFGAWFLVNGLFAAGLAKAAGARWSSSLVGGAVAWMTSINPFLAPGWFTGYVELQYDPVNISDIGTLNELLANEEKPIPDLLEEMFAVPLFRLIVVIAATNIGSIVASALFVAYLLPLFALDLGGAAGVTQLLFEGAQNGWEILWSTIT